MSLRSDYKRDGYVLLRGAIPAEALDRVEQETLGLRNLRIERLPFDSYVSFAVLD